jgi:hypothetical protein
MPRKKEYEERATLAVGLEKENYDQLVELAHKNKFESVSDFVKAKFIKPTLAKAGHEWKVYDADEAAAKEAAKVKRAKGKTAKAAPEPVKKATKKAAPEPAPKSKPEPKWTKEKLLALKKSNPAKYKQVKTRLAEARA